MLLMQREKLLIPHSLNDMDEIQIAMEKVRSNIKRIKGGTIYFFGLLERTDSEAKWDVVISADWIIDNNSPEDLEFVINELKAEFGDSLTFLGRIILFKSSEDFINDLGWALNQVGKSVIVNSEEMFNLKISNDISIRHLQVVECDFSQLSVCEPFEVLRVPETSVETV